MGTELRTKKLSRSWKVTGTGDGVLTVVMSAEEMWKYKREKQREDIEGLKNGTLSPDDANWFSGGLARRAKIIGYLI